MTRNRTFNIFFIIILLVNLTGIFNRIFVADSALYAAISKNMLLTNNWLELFVNGNDWLDKPHFQFWLCALSMKIFGVNAIAYKLPSFLSFLLALVYIYRFSVKIYSKEVGLVALLVFSSALHIIVSNNDVRAEAIMLPLMIAGIYHFYFLSYTNKLRDLFLGALFTAAAIMTKGIFILIPIAGGILADIVLKKRWNMLFRWRWLWGFLLIFVFILPELWSVYYQFDMHPETEVFGRTHVSGVKFFFWDSQFGRFFNTGPIKGKGDPSFFLHTMLWAFGPWSLLAFASLFTSIRSVVKKQPLKEYATLSGFLIMFVVFSMSKFQLPHYLNILFPYLSIIVASYIVSLTPKGLKFYKISQIINIAIFFPLAYVVFMYFRPGRILVLALLTVFVLGMGWYVVAKEKKVWSKYLYLSVLVSVHVGLFLNLVFYPKLLTYQGEIDAAKYANQHYPDKIKAATFQIDLFEFYVDGQLERIKNVDQLRQLDPGSIIFTQKEYLESLETENIDYALVKTFSHYRITRLKPKFLNPDTRDETLRTFYLIEIKD